MNINFWKEYWSHGRHHKHGVVVVSDSGVVSGEEGLDFKD